MLFAAKEMAHLDKKSLGIIISDPARRALLTAAGKDSATGASDPSTHQVSARLAAYGICPLPARGGIVSNELVDRLRDLEGI